VKRTRQKRPQLSSQARDVTASAQPPGVTISRMDTLRRRGQPDEAVELLKQSLAADPTAAVGLLALLRAAARLNDARLLLELARDSGPALCSRVAKALSASGATDDARFLYGALEQYDLSTLIGVVGPLDSSRSAEPLVEVILRHTAEEFVATLAQLRQQGQSEGAGIVVDVLCQGPPEKTVSVAQSLAQRGLRSDARLVIESYATRAQPHEAASAFLSFGRFWPEAAAASAMAIADRRDAVTVIQMLDEAGRQPPEGRPLAELVRLLPARSIAQLCHALCSTETYDHVEAILTQCAQRPDRDELRMALYELDLHSAAYHLAEPGPLAPLANLRTPADDGWR
jgi:hypothetical protein